jgi:hypothetical protein
MVLKEIDILAEKWQKSPKNNDRNLISWGQSYDLKIPRYNATNSIARFYNKNYTQYTQHTTKQAHLCLPKKYFICFV